MTEILTVPTHFGDLSELSSGLADRVDEERIILYGPSSYDEGDYVSFEVLLLDGTPALEGIGRVAAAVDGGEARAPETRFDIVFDTLQLEGRSEVVYERIVLARQSMLGDEPPTGEVDVSQLDEGEDVATDFQEEQPEDVAVEAEAAEPEAVEEADEDFVSFSDSELPPAPEETEAHDAAAFAEVAEATAFAADAELDADLDGVDAELDGMDAELDADLAGLDAEMDELPADQATVVAAVEDLRPVIDAPTSAPPPALPQEPAGFELPPPPTGLTRPVHAATWWPTASARPEPQASTGYFDHVGSLPIPEEPPRPDIDPTQRVSPAPRPSAADLQEHAEVANDAPVHDEPVHEEDLANDEPETSEEPLQAQDPSDGQGEYEEPPLDHTIEAPLEYEESDDIDVPPVDYDMDATAHEMQLPDEEV